MTATSAFPAWSVPAGVTGSVVAEPTPAEASGREAPRGRGAAVDRLVLDDAGARHLLRGLRAARADLVERPVKEIARAVGDVAARFLDPSDDLRREALDRLPPTAGISPQMALTTLEGMAADWQTGRLEALLAVELGGGAALDGFVTDATGRRSRALGAPLTVHVCAGTVPGVSVASMVRALLVKSAVLLKPGWGDVVLPVLFRRGLEGADRRLSSATAVVYWPGGYGEPLERAALADADLAVVYGGDESVRAVRAKVAGTTPVVVHPHRVGFAVVGGGVPPARAGAVAAAAARAVALFDQRGCVSPHLVYVVGDERAASKLAEALAERLRLLEGDLPPGPPDLEGLAAVQQLRGAAELLAASGRGTIWKGEDAGWTVVWDPDPTFEPSCLGRSVRVKAVDSVESLLGAVGPFYRHLQTVGVAGMDEGALSKLAEGLARLGPARVTSLESAPWPPPWWHHDGVGALTSLLRWSDLEEGID